MTPGMIRPSAGVRVPDEAQSALGMGGRGNMLNNNQPQQSGLSFIQNLLTRAAGQQQHTGGAFNWGESGGGFFEDDGLKELKNGTNFDSSSIEYHAERAAGAVKEFWQQTYNRTGPFYNLYKQAKEEFKNNGLGQACPIRTAFIEDVNRSPDFTRVMATNGSPFFGWLIVNTYRQENRDNLTANEYMQFAFTSYKNIFMFELISWLMKTKTGHRFINNLSQELQMRISKLNDYKELGLQAFDIYGLSFPYAKLEFKVSQVSRPDYSTLITEMGFSGPLMGDPAAVRYEVGNGIQNTNQNSINVNSDLDDFILNNARRGMQQENRAHFFNEFNEERKKMDWNHTRTDFQNMTPDNLSEFDIKGQFHNIGLENHFFVPEENWVHLQKLYKKHPEMGTEESVLQDCYRVVKIDLELNDGWTSTIVRVKGLDMSTVLTDPKTLLPFLEDSSKEETWSTGIVEMDVALKPGKLQIDVEECTRLVGKGIAVIPFKDNLVDNSDSSLKNHIGIINRSLAGHLKTENAVCFETIVWDTYTCASSEDFTRICADMPYLFKDANPEEHLSFYQVCRNVVEFASEEIVNENFIKFVDSHLTAIVNNWLINSCGYIADKSSPRHLSVDSILEDFRPLSSHLKETNPEANKWLHNLAEPHFLVENARIFTLNNNFNKSEGDSSYIDQAKRAISLNVVRPFLTVMLNNRPGPLRPKDNEVITIKRSRFPEYFKMVEDGFKATMKTYKEAEGVSKLIHFTSSSSTWLFSYSTLDNNVATLRQVSDNDPLVLLSLQ